MLACPNINTKEWKDLVKAVGQREAFREYMKLSTGSIPNVIDVVPLVNVPFSKVEDTESTIKLTEEVAQDLMDFLEKKFPGVNGKVINDKDLKWKGKLDGKVPTINLAYAQASDGFHEFSHPFLMALRRSNPEAFNSLYNSLKETEEWTEIETRATARVDKLYPELKAPGNLDLYKEEVLATAIGLAAELRLATSAKKISSRLGKIVDNIFKWINSFFTEFFSDRVKTTQLSANTSFGQLIDMFVDTRTKILIEGDWGKLSDNLMIADAMGGYLSNNLDMVESDLAEGIAEELTRDKKFNLDEYVNKWLDKNFRVPERDYIPRKQKPSQIAISVARTMIETAQQKGYQLRGYDLKKLDKVPDTKAIGYGVTKTTLERVAEALTPVALNFKFANYLAGKNNVPLSLNQPLVTIKDISKPDENGNMPETPQLTASIPMSIAEAEAVIEFQQFLQEKFPGRKSIPANELNEEYLGWVTKNYGINWVNAVGHVGYGLDKLSDVNYDDYTRILFVDDYVNQNKHTFQIANTGLSGNGLGWYASAKIQGDRFDHEFQSDILPEISKSFKEGMYNEATPAVLNKGSKESKVTEMVENRVYSMINASHDFLIVRNEWLKEKIFTVDKEYQNSRLPRQYDVNETDQDVQTNLGIVDEFVELPFSKLDTYNPVRLEEVKSYLLSELDVQLEETVSSGWRLNQTLYYKVNAKVLNLFLGRKSEDQQALFNWIKTFRKEKYKNQENTFESYILPGQEDLPFSKTEETDSPVITNHHGFDYYLTEESFKTIPAAFLKIFEQYNAWANGGFPVRPSDKTATVQSLARDVARSSVRYLIGKDGNLKKNFGYNRTAAKAYRDTYRTELDKMFKTYNHLKKRYKALEWRKTVYADVNNIVRIAEFYKGQFNRFYKFYNDVYESAVPIAEKDIKGREQDSKYGMYKKYNDLYYKWFDIIIPQSINSAKAEGRTHYYLPTAMAMNKIEGNNIAEKVYWTPSDNMEARTSKEGQLLRDVTSFVSQNTPESTAAIRNYLGQDVLSNYTQQTTAENIATDLIFTTDFQNSEVFNQFLSTDNLVLTKPNGPLYNALVKYARKNNIKLSFEKPSWSNTNLIKVDLTGYTIKPIDRFSKLDPAQTDRVQEKTPEEKSSEAGFNYIVGMANMLANNLGVEYSMVTPDQARAMTEKATNPWNGEPSFFYNGKVYFVEGNMTKERVLHEFSHPLVDAIFASNPKLFNNVYNALLATPEGALLSEQVEQLYPEMKTTDPLFKKEVLVRALTHEAMSPTKSKGFSESIKKILFAIKQALRSVFGTAVKVDKLNTNTSLEELAGMLKSDRFNLDPETFESKDVQYARDLSEFTEAVESVENSVVSEVISNYYKVVNNQIKRIRKSKKYEDARDLLIDDETKSGILQGIKLTLENSAEIDKRLESLLNEMESREKNTNSLVSSILKMDALTQKISKRVNELKTNIDNKDNLSNIIYYDYLLKNWSNFVDKTNVKMFDAGVDPLSKFGQLLTGLKGRMDTTRRQIVNSYGPGVVTVLKESLAPLIQGIDDFYSNRIKELESKGNVNPRLIEEIKAEWDTNRLTDEKILDLMTNKAGDTNIFSYFAEAYTNSPDPIVGGFAIYVKNAYNRADAIIQRNLNDFNRDMESLLKKAGYSRTNFTSLMSQLIFRDTVSFVNSKTNAVEKKEMLTFLNPFKNVDNIIAQYTFDIEKAQMEGRKEDADNLIKEKRKHLRDYFHQEYVKEYYEREALYDNIEADQSLKEMAYKLSGIDMNTATADQKATVSDFYNEVAKEAYREKYLLLNQIKELEGHNYFDESTFEESVEETQMLWRDYTRMASLTDAKGNPKTGRELLKANIERKFRKANNKFNEWVPITGMGNKPSFEFALRSYEQSLVNAGITDPEEFKEKRQRWLDKNTTIAYTDEFYRERNRILDKLKAVLATIPKNTRENIDSTKELEEMLDMVTGFRDEDGQIIGSDMSKASKDKIRALQQAVADKRSNMAGFSGLTKTEMDELGGLYEKIISKQKLTPEERNRLQELQDAQALNGVDKATRAEINILYKQLAELQSKEATDYYVNTVNEFLNDMGEPLVDNVTANDLSDPSVYVRLFNKSPEFEKWFKENHILREVYDKEEDAMINVYDRLFVWNRTRPNNPDHYVTTTLTDGEVIPGKPVLAYYYRAVKDDVSKLQGLRNKASLTVEEQNTLKTLEAKEANGTLEVYRTKKEVGKTVDNKGNWLPLTMAEGAVSNLYQNEAYEKLRRENKAAFDVLEKMKEYHLKFQEGNPNSKKLYMQVPRYGSMAIENVTKLGTRENLKRVLSNIRQIFFKRSDDYEDGLNMEPQKLAYMDMLESDITNIPVTGLYDLKPEEVSMNLLDSMSKYMLSSVRQQELLDINPYAQAIKEVLKSHPDVEGDQTNRAKAVENLYEREFMGKKLKGFLSQNNATSRFVQKSTSKVAKTTSLGFFALDMPSAIKNALAAKVSQWIEATGGRFLGPLSLAKGRLEAFRVMSVDGMMGLEYYNTGNRSLHLQMLQVFDPGQEYFKKATSTSFGRSFASDFVTGSWLMSPRKFLQYEATLGAFFGMMHHVQVEQTIDGETKMIPYMKAWEVKNGQIELKEGIDKKWAPGGSEFNTFKNRSHELTNRLEGTYSEFDQPEINRYFLMRQMLFMKKFFMSMAANYVSVNRPSAALGTMSAGMYANVIRVLYNSIPGFELAGKKYGRYGLQYMWSYMSPDEKAAMKKFVSQALIIAGFYATMYLMFDYDEDELQKSLNVMKKRSGPALAKNFKLDGWLINNAEVTLYKTLTEVQTWSHPIIATKTIAELAYQSALWDKGVKDPVKILYNTFQGVRGEKDAFYAKDSGPYPWQKKGGSKAVTDLAKIFGFTGSTLDPTRSMKNHQTLARELNFR